MNKERLIAMVSKNIDIGHYAIMDIIAKEPDTQELWNHLKLRGWREALIRKNLIQEIDNKFVLTEQGINVYKEISGIKELEVATKDLNLTNEVEQICKKIVEEVNSKILLKTGKKRYALKSGKMLNITVKELQNRLIYYVNSFKFTNFTNIEKAILAYVDDVLEGKVGYPRTIPYFIWKRVVKDGSTEIISDMETYIETLDDSAKIVDKSKLFG